MKRIFFSVLIGLMLGLIILVLQPACIYLPQYDLNAADCNHDESLLLVSLGDPVPILSGQNYKEYLKTNYKFNGVPCPVEDLQKQLDRVSGVMDGVSVLLVADKNVSLARYMVLRSRIRLDKFRVRYVTLSGHVIFID